VKLLLKNLLFTLVMPGTVAVYLPLWLTVDKPLPAGPIRWLGALVIAVGACVYGWCVWDFATFGRGTPAPIDAPTKLVVRGLYRHTRNPMYVGVLTTIVGWALLFRSGALSLYAAAIFACFHGFVVLYEEPHLERVFREEYVKYRGRVGRWLWK